MLIPLSEIELAAKKVADVALRTPIEFCPRLSELFESNIYLKREDLQTVRSFKSRGAYNLISSLNQDEKERGVVCASAGNHAQGVALSCQKLGVRGVIFMPLVTPNQKINRVRSFGGNMVEIKLVGDTYDEASKEAKEYCKSQKMVYVHPYNDQRTMAGQGTIGKEIFEEVQPDYVLVAIGGGGLIGGVGSYFKQISPETKIIGVQVKGARSLYESLKVGKIVPSPEIDTFCDGVAVVKTEELAYKTAQEVVDDIVLINEGRVATDMISLYQNEGIITEPAGAMAVSGLAKVKDQIKNKKVVCIICGGNNDISRYPEIVEKSLVWKGLKHYFVVEFSQKPGQLKKFLDKVLGPDDDITRFEYIKKTNKDKGAALVGIQLSKKEDLDPLLDRFMTSGIEHKKISTNDLIYQVLV